MFTKMLVSWILFWLINKSLGTVNHKEKHFINEEFTNYLDEIKPGKIEDKSIVESPFCKENCLVDEDFDSTPNEVTKRGRARQEDPENEIMVERKFNHFSSMFGHHAKSCSCGSQKRLIDMGPDYFPRYISDMLCMPGGCDKHHECRPRHSKVWAIRRRQEDEYPGTEPVPKDLREFWIGETIISTVDCECSRI